MTQLQIHILQIFEVVKNIIEKHNLNYMAIGGTAIGAVRHGGFIPWDDDLDIAMPRKDYDKLMELLKTELPPHLEVRTHNNSEHYCIKFSKVMDKSTTVIEGLFPSYPDLDEGVYVDIMPIDGLPDCACLRKYHVLKLSVLNKLDAYTTYSFEFFHDRYSKLLFKTFSWLRYILPKGFLRSLYFKEVSKYSVLSCSEMGFKWPYPRFRNIVLPSAYLQDTAEMPFENTTIRMIKNYDEYLTLHFGDYMKLPPEDEQVSRHDFVVVDFNTPYREYRKNNTVGEKEV